MDDKSQTNINSNNSSRPTAVVEPVNKKSPLEATSEAEQPSFFDSFTKTVGEVTEAIATIANDLGAAATKQAHDLIAQATQGAGEVVNSVSDNWLVGRVTRFLNLDWLLGATDSVDLVQAEAAVRKLQQEYPQESPSQIAHRIMVEKATYAGGIGLASSVLPGLALALLAVDLAATTKLQAEMVYQIAAVYGLDLKDPARKGEVLGIFGLGLGGGRLLKAAGLGLLRNVPFAGAMIGASSNAAMLYSLGYAACQFYEAKLDASSAVTSEAKLAEIKQQSNKYLETAIAQQIIMDQMLVHMILASHPEKSWQEIQPQLKVLNLSPDSLKAIGNNIKSPQPLDTLLNQLNRDFAIPLLAQCYRISQSNDVKATEAKRLMDAIATKFNIDLSSIKTVVES